MENPNQYTVVLRCFVKKGEEILVVMRTMKDSHGAGRWEVPGGKLEHGEDPEAAIRRELKEETGINVKNVKPVHVATFETPGRFVLAVGYIAEIDGTGEITLSEEHDEYKWLDLASFSALGSQEWLVNTAKKILG